MKTLHLDPDGREGEEQELLSPHQVADRLGFSRQHVVRLIEAGEMEAHKLPGSSYWRIPLATVLAFEERRERAGERADAFSRSLMSRARRLSEPRSPRTVLDSDVILSRVLYEPLGRTTGSQGSGLEVARQGGH